MLAVKHLVVADAPERQHAAAASLAAFLAVEVGVFASTFAQRIEERNLFYLAPLFLIPVLVALGDKHQHNGHHECRAVFVERVGAKRITLWCP